MVAIRACQIRILSSNSIILFRRLTMRLVSRNLHNARVRNDCMIIFLVMIVLMVTGGMQAWSQTTLSAYQYSTNASGSLTDMSSGSTQLYGAGTDDASCCNTSIGFTYTFCGTAYSYFSVSSNGALGRRTPDGCISGMRVCRKELQDGNLHSRERQTF